MNRRPALCALRRLGRDHGGQSLVEFVLALPILLVIVFGIIEFANAWRTYQVITNAAREGARVAVLPGTVTDTDVTNHVDSLLTASNLSLASRTITLTCQGTPPSHCWGPGSSGQSEGVQVDYLHNFVVLGPVLDLMCAGCGTSFGTVTLTSRSVMRNE